jgi:hypothetical protein
MVWKSFPTHLLGLGLLHLSGQLIQVFLQTPCRPGLNFDTWAILPWIDRKAAARRIGFVVLAA